MNILVTGGAGFVGSHLVKRLVRDGHRVTVLDNLHRAQLDCMPGADLRVGDIRDRTAVRKAMPGVDVVFHLAAQSSVAGAAADPEYTFSTNVTGTLHVLSEARAAGVRRLVFTSSREVYGDPLTLPVAEDFPLNPKNAYGDSKVAGERYCRASEEGGLGVAILRLTNVYGQGDRDRVLPLFAARAKRGDPLIIYGTGKILDFVWVESVVDALWEASQRDVAGQAINVGSGQGTTLETLAERIIAHTGSHSRIERSPARDPEVGRFVANVSRARALLDYCTTGDPLQHLPAVLDSDFS